jgi:DNA repair protein RadC
MAKRRSLFDGSAYKGYRVSIKLVRESLEEYEPVRLEGPEDVYSFMKELQDSDRERFYSLFLDGRNTVISCEEVSSGSPNTTIVHPREVFKSAFLCSSTAVIFVHNHPSGDPEPSFDDKAVTGRLYQCGDLLGIDVLDSIIIGNGSYYSFEEKGLMDAYRGHKIPLK